MNTRCALGLVLALAACGDAKPTEAKFELRDVVAPALAEFGALATESLDVPAVEGALPEELQGMLESLGTERGSMREAILKDLQDRGDEWTGFLARTLDDAGSSNALRAAALEVLARRDSPRSVEVLVNALTLSRDVWVRAQCAWRLCESRQDRFLPRILLRLKYETDEETAIWLAECGARHGNYAGVDGVCVIRDRARTPELAAFANEHLATLAASAQAADGDALNAQWFSGELERKLPPPAISKELACEGWKWIQALAQWDLRVVDDRRFALSHSGAWIVEPLARTLHEKNVYLRVHAAQCLERMGRRASGAGAELLAALGEPRVAPAAAAALGAIGHVAACERLEQALGASDLELVCAAARALGALGQPRSIAPLRKAFAAEEPPDLRQAAAESLLALDAADVVPYLVTRMTAENAENVAAENALGAWLARKAKAGDEASARRLADWDELDPLPAGEIPTREQSQARLAARAKLASSW